MTNIPQCEYNYHDDDHEDLCVFECTLDGPLEPDSQLTEPAQQYRDELIKGVERMLKKVNHYKKENTMTEIKFRECEIPDDHVLKTDVLSAVNHLKALYPDMVVVIDEVFAELIQMHDVS